MFMLDADTRARYSKYKEVTGGELSGATEDGKWEMVAMLPQTPGPEGTLIQKYLMGYLKRTIVSSADDKSGSA